MSGQLKAGRPGFQNVVVARMLEKFGAAAVGHLLPNDITNARTHFWPGVWGRVTGGLSGVVPPASASALHA